MMMMMTKKNSRSITVPARKFSVLFVTATEVTAILDVLCIAL
jgi:hypothetical protein